MSRLLRALTALFTRRPVGDPSRNARAAVIRSGRVNGQQIRDMTALNRRSVLSDLSEADVWSGHIEALRKRGVL